MQPSTPRSPLLASLLLLICSPTHTPQPSLGDEVRWFQGVWEQIIHVYWPLRSRSTALLTGPEADVLFEEVAVERFSEIINGEAEGAVKE